MKLLGSVLSVFLVGGGGGCGCVQKGKYRKAMDIFRRIIKGLQMRHSGRPHHLIGLTYHNMGMLDLWQGHLSEAEQHFKDAITIRRQTLSPEHVDVVVSTTRLSMVQFALGRTNEAVQSMQAANDMCIKENVSKAKILNNLGVLHTHHHNYLEAVKCFTHALQIQRKCLQGPVKRPATVFDASVSMSNLGKLYLLKHDITTAVHVLEEALLLQTTSFRKDSNPVIRSMDDLALAKTLGGEHKRAIQMYRGVLKSQESLYGTNDPATMVTLGVLGYLYILHQNDEQALKCLLAVYKWQQRNLDPHHPCVQHVKDTLKKIEERIQGEVSVWI